MRGVRQRIDRPFLTTLIAIVVFGLVMLLSASGPLGIQRFNDSWFFFKHQIVYGIIPGIILFYVFSRLDYKKLRSLSFAGLVASILLLVLVYLPGIGLHFGGAGRWVRLGFFSFQPSEFVKVTFLIYVAGWMAARYETTARSLQEGLIPFLCALGAVLLLLILQPNTGSMTIIAGSALAVYLVAGAPLVWFAGIGAFGVGLIALLIKITPYRAARFMTFLHPELDPQGIGYHINQAFLAIGSGGPFGLGYGQSRQKYLYLPEVAGDSIFAIIAEEMGFIVSVFLILAMAFLIYRCFIIAKRAPDAFGKFLAVGIGSWFAIQSIFNIGSMIGLLPITGVTLPFISYGSSSMVALFIAAGIIASISRQMR